MGEDKGCFRYGKMAENASFTSQTIENVWVFVLQTVRVVVPPVAGYL